MHNSSEKKNRLKLQTCFLTVGTEIKAWAYPMLLPDLHVHDSFYKVWNNNEQNLKNQQWTE